MRKLSEKSRRLLKWIFRGIGVTAASLVFQACYGMPPDMDDYAHISGTVRCKESETPVKDINVSVRGTTSSSSYTITRTDSTSTDGQFSIWIPRQERFIIEFEDIDGPDNGGWFQTKTMNVSLYETRDQFDILLDKHEE